MRRTVISFLFLSTAFVSAAQALETKQQPVAVTSVTVRGDDTHGKGTLFANAEACEEGVSNPESGTEIYIPSPAVMRLRGGKVPAGFRRVFTDEQIAADVRNGQGRTACALQDTSYKKPLMGRAFAEGGRFAGQWYTPIDKAKLYTDGKRTINIDCWNDSVLPKAEPQKDSVPIKTESVIISAPTTSVTVEKPEPKIVYQDQKVKVIHRTQIIHVYEEPTVVNGAPNYYIEAPETEEIEENCPEICEPCPEAFVEDDPNNWVWGRKKLKKGYVDSAGRITERDGWYDVPLYRRQ